MRIIAGNLKGRRIPFNIRKHGSARVTSDFVKKAAFSILVEDLTGKRFLDLFACSGQIGLEAFSRGAEVVMNEADRRRHRFVSGLVDAWGLRDRIRILCRPAEKLLPALAAEPHPFDVIYLDPPYHTRLRGIPFCRAILQRLVLTPSILEPSGAVLVQHEAGLDLPDSLPPLSILKQKPYGNTLLSVYGASREA